ncbi:MAG: capsule assembly Wzi family protein [Armatimonadota bacterium]
MKRLTTTIIVLAAVLISLLSCTWAATRTVPSADRVPIGDWTYDAMISLASDGAVPGMAARVFQGDRLFNRFEMADVVISIVANDDIDGFTPAQTSLIDKLILEFRPEIMVKDAEIIDRWSDTASNEKKSIVTGYIQGAAVHDVNGTNSIKVPYRITGYTDLNDHIFATGTLADKETRFFHQFSDTDTLDKAFIKGYDSNFVWSVGKNYVNWSPAYTGSLIMSDNSPSFLMLNGNIDIDLGKIFGKFKLSQFAGTFSDDDKTLYLFGRRLEKPIANNLYFGISESAKTNKAPNPLIMALPFLAYQEIFSSIDEHLSYMGSLDLMHQMKNGHQIYAQYLIDEMTSPSFWPGNHNDTPKQTGYVIGYYTPRLIKSDHLSTLRVEYIFIDPLTYRATRDRFPELEYTNDGRWIGHPLGRNNSGLYLRGEHYFSDKFSLIAEYLNQKQNKGAEPVIGSSSTVSGQLSYDLTPSTSISARIAHTRIKSPGEETEKETQYELRFIQSF